MKKERKNTNKKILESKRIIKEEKEKIKIEKRNIRKKKYAWFRNTKLYKFFNKYFNLFRNDRDTYSFSELLVVTLVSLVVGAFACFSVFMVMSGGKNYFKLSNELDKFVEVYETLTDNYYDTVDKEELIEEAIDGMVSSVGDVYTSYMDVDGVDSFNELVSGEYEGIGCTIQRQEDGVKIIEVFEDSPAKESGLEKDDIILKVDDIEVVESTDIVELSNYIKSESGDKITMVISRDGEEKTLTLKRDKIETPVVYSSIYEKNNKKIGYLNITLFSSNANKQFKEKLKELENNNIDGLIIDVRGNNGGYLTTVTDIVSQLLPRGKVIYQIEKNEDREVTKDKTSASRNYPIAVLTNYGSASASEILAGAIKESYDNGFVVGTTTFGKGTVQQVKKLSDGSMVKYTVENWLTPDGNWIDGIGIEPTNIVELNETYYENPTTDNDNQLQEALNLVSK